MAVDKKTIDYVKNQLNAGYTPQQIKAALANSGYTQADINQAMAAGGATAAAAKPAAKGAAGAKPTAGAAPGEVPIIGFVVSLVGGILILLAALLPVMGMTFFDDMFAFFPVILALDATLVMILGIVFGIVMIVGGVLANKIPDNKAPGLIVLVISVIVLLIGTQPEVATEAATSGFFLGALIGIIGGVLAIIGK